MKCKVKLYPYFLTSLLQLSWPFLRPNQVIKYTLFRGLKKNPRGILWFPYCRLDRSLTRTQITPGMVHHPSRLSDESPVEPLLWDRCPSRKRRQFQQILWYCMGRSAERFNWNSRTNLKFGIIGMWEMSITIRSSSDGLKEEMARSNPWGFSALPFNQRQPFSCCVKPRKQQRITFIDFQPTRTTSSFQYFNTRILTQKFKQYPLAHLPIARLIVTEIPTLRRSSSDQASVTPMLVTCPLPFNPVRSWNPWDSQIPSSSQLITNFAWYLNFNNPIN